jgi:hypothetical protein
MGRRHGYRGDATRRRQQESHLGLRPIRYRPPTGQMDDRGRSGNIAAAMGN